MNQSNTFQQQYSQLGIMNAIPPPQMPQQPQIKLLGSSNANQNMKLPYQQTPNQAVFSNQSQYQLVQIQQNQNSNNQVYLKTNGSSQNFEVKQSSKVIHTNGSTSSICSNSKFPYKVKNIIQEINLQSSQQNNIIPQIQVRNRFLNNQPEVYQNSFTNSQFQHPLENGRSLSSNVIIPTQGSQVFQNNHNNNFIQARRNSNCSTQHNSSVQQNSSFYHPIIQSVQYGLLQNPSQIAPFIKKTDNINEKILNHENKLKEFLQDKNFQIFSEQNQNQFEALASSRSSKGLQNVENQLQKQNVCIVNNQIKLSPEKNVFKTVITYMNNQPQQTNYSQQQQQQYNMNKFSVDNKQTFNNTTIPTFVPQDHQSKQNVGQLLDNSNFKLTNNISPSQSSSTIQSPKILRGYKLFDQNKNQNQSGITTGIQGFNIFETQNIPSYLDQKPNTEVYKQSVNGNSNIIEKQNQSPALTFAQNNNDTQSRKSSISDFQLNKQSSLNQQSLSPLPKSPVSSFVQQEVRSISPNNTSNINQINEIKNQQKEDLTKRASVKNENNSATQNFIYKLKDQYFTPQNLDQSSTKNEINLLALQNNTISKTPSLNSRDLTPSNAPLVHVQQSSSLSPSIQSPTKFIQQSNQQQNQQKQEDEKEKQILVYRLHSPKPMSKSNSQSILNEDQNNNLQKSKQASISKSNQQSPISNKIEGSQSQSILNSNIQFPLKNTFSQLKSSVNEQTIPFQPKIQTQPQNINKIIEGDKQEQTIVQLNSQLSQQSLQGIPPYTPLLFPAYKGIQNPLENLGLIQQRTFLSRQPSPEKQKYASHSPARSVQSDIQRSNHLFSPFTAAEKQINQQKNRPNSLENSKKSLSQSPTLQNQDVIQTISLSQNPQGFIIQQNVQTQIPVTNAPIINNIITSSPEEIKSQKIQASHNAQIPNTNGVKINTLVEHQIKDYQNYLKSSPAGNVKIIENNIIFDNQQIQDSIDQKQNSIFTFQTISSPFPSTNKNILSHQPSAKKNSFDLKQFANSPLGIQNNDLSNNSNFFQNNEIKKVIGQFDSEGKQYQDLLSQIDESANKQSQRENSFLNQDNIISKPQNTQIFIENSQKQNQNLETKEAMPNNSGLNQLQYNILHKDQNPQTDESRKMHFSFQDNKNVKESPTGQRQDKIIEENIDKLIGNIFKEALNNVNQTINQKRNELNSQFLTSEKQNIQQVQEKAIQKTSDQQALSLNSAAQNFQQNQQKVIQKLPDQQVSKVKNQQDNKLLVDQFKVKDQNINMKFDQMIKNEEISNPDDSKDSTKKSQQKNQQKNQGEQEQNQEIISQNSKAEKQLKQQPPVYLAKNLNTINELEGDALSAFKKLENGQTVYLPLDDNKKKELAQSWQKPDYFQSLILEQLDKDKKQIKQLSSKKNLKNSLTQFSKPIERSSGNSQSSMKQSDSYQKLIKQSNSEVKNFKDELQNSNNQKTKGFLFKEHKEKSEQKFSQPPNVEQKFSNQSPERYQQQDQINEDQTKKNKQEKVFPFFQSSSSNNQQKNKSLTFQNSQSNSRQNSVDKQRSIVDKIENTFEEAQVIGSFGQLQNFNIPQLEVKSVKNQRSVAQFQQPYPSLSLQSQQNSKQNSPQSQKLKNFLPDQDIEKEEPQYLDQAPTEYPQSFQENSKEDILLTPQYEESEKDKKYRHFLLKMLNNYKEKREEILNKIDKLNKKQQIEQITGQPFNLSQVQKNNSSIVEPQKLIYKPQKCYNESEQNKQISPQKQNQGSNQKKKKFDVNMYISNAYSENEMQQQIQQYEMLIKNDTQSPENQRRNKESYLNSLISSPDQTNEQKQYYVRGQSPDLHEGEDQNQMLLQSKGRKLRPCEFQNIFQNQKEESEVEKTTFKGEYYKNAQFKESPKKSKSISPQNPQQNEKPPQMCQRAIDKQNKQQVIEKHKNSSNNNNKTYDGTKRNLNDIESKYKVNNINISQNQTKSRNQSTSKSPNTTPKSPYQKQPLIDKQRQNNLRNNSRLNQKSVKQQYSQIEKSDMNNNVTDPQIQNKKLQGQSFLRDKNKISDNIINKKNQKGDQSLQKKQSNQQEELNSDFNNSQNMENIYPVHQQSNKNLQQFNILLQNTFESQNQNSKEDSQVEINQNYSEYSYSQNNKKNIYNTAKQLQANKYYQQNIQNNQAKGGSNYVSSKKVEKVPHTGIIQNINDMQKYSEYMIENNQNLLKDLDQSLDRVSRNSSQNNKSRNNSNSAGRSIIREIGSFFKYQKEQEISPQLRPISGSVLKGQQQYLDSRQSISSPERIQDSQNDYEFQNNSSNPINNKLYVQIRKTIHSISPPHSQEQQKGNYFNLPQYYSHRRVGQKESKQI